MGHIWYVLKTNKYYNDESKRLTNVILQRLQHLSVFGWYFATFQNSKLAKTTQN